MTQVATFQRKSVPTYGGVLLRAPADERRTTCQTGSAAPTNDKATPRFVSTPCFTPHGFMHVEGTATPDHRPVANLKVTCYEGIYMPSLGTARKADSRTA